MKYDKDELLQTLKDYEKQLKEKDEQIRDLNQKLIELRIATADRTRERAMYIHAGRLRSFTCMCGRLYINEDWKRSEK